MRYQKHGLQLSGDHDRRTTWLRLSFWRVLVQFSWDHQPMWGDPVILVTISVLRVKLSFKVVDGYADLNFYARVRG